MLRKFFLLVLLASFAAVAAPSARAQIGGRWVLLGERHIDGRVDNDKIDVGRDNGRFRAIQFRVNDGTVRFDHIRVKYLNGEVEDIGVGSEIPPGGRTRMIDLPGERRTIESISMWYEKANWHTRPRVRVYGIR